MGTGAPSAGLTWGFCTDTQARRDNCSSPPSELRIRPVLPSSSSRGSSEADVARAGSSEHSAQTALEQPVLRQEPRCCTREAVTSLPGD